MKTNEPTPKRIAVAEPAPADAPQTGLCLIGTVINRRRKSNTDKSGAVRFLISLTVMAGGLSYQADRWTDRAMPSDTPEIGSEVTLPVRARAYSTKNGVAQMRLEWGPGQAYGEEF